MSLPDAIHPQDHIPQLRRVAPYLSVCAPPWQPTATLSLLSGNGEPGLAHQAAHVRSRGSRALALRAKRQRHGRGRVRRRAGAHHPARLLPDLDRLAADAAGRARRGRPRRRRAGAQLPHNGAAIDARARSPRPRPLEAADAPHIERPAAPAVPAAPAQPADRSAGSTVPGLSQRGQRLVRRRDRVRRGGAQAPAVVDAGRTRGAAQPVKMHACLHGPQATTVLLRRRGGGSVVRVAAAAVDVAAAPAAVLTCAAPSAAPAASTLICRAGEAPVRKLLRRGRRVVRCGERRRRRRGAAFLGSKDRSRATSGRLAWRRTTSANRSCHVPAACRRRPGAPAARPAAGGRHDAT